MDNKPTRVKRKARRRLVWTTSGEEPSLNEYRGGSPQSIDNIDYFLERFQEQLSSKKQMTFRTAVKRLMNLMDLID